MTRPRILIADDHALVAAGLRAMLEPAHEVVEVVSNGLDVMAAVDRQQPDLVLLDISLPGRSGMDVARELGAHPSEVPFVMLTMHGDPIYADEAIAAGASGFVVKMTGPDELRRAIALVLAGQVYVSPQVTRREALPTAPKGLEPGPRRGVKALTARQAAVLTYIAKGWGLKDIADEMGISVRSVEFHRRRIRSALGLNSTAAMVRYAIAEGLVKQ